MGKHTEFEKVKAPGQKVKDEWIVYLGNKDVPENTKELTLTIANKYKYRNGTVIRGDVPIVDRSGHKNYDLLVLPIDSERFTQTGYFQTKDWLPDGTRNLKSYKQTRIIIQRPNRKRQKIKLIEVYFDVMRQCHSLAPIPRCDKRYSEDTCGADDLIDDVEPEDEINLEP